MTEKKIDVVDENDMVVGSSNYHNIMKKGLIFRTANVLVFESNGKLFVHKRSSNLDTFPGMYDTKLGGIVDSGESYEDAARRELKEEAAIENVKLEYLFPLRYRTNDYNNNRRIFRCTYKGEMKLQKEEIESGKFMTFEDVKMLLKEGKVSPSGKFVFEEYLKWKNQKKY